MFSLPPSDSVLLVIYLVAITAEAMSGALAAGRRRMDIFGVVVIAFVTALGGGTIRDLTLGRFPKSEEHTSELQSLMRNSYAVLCLIKKNTNSTQHHTLAK